MKQWIQSCSIASALMTSLLYAGLEGKRVGSLDIVWSDSQEKQAKEQLPSTLHTQIGKVFSQEKFDLDLKTLALHFDLVEPEIEESLESLSIRLCLKSPPFLEKIIWKGAKTLSSSSLKKAVSLEENQWLDRRAVQESLSRVRQLYLQKGFYKVDVSYKLEKQKSGKTHLFFLVEEGPSGKIDRILYAGLRPEEIQKIEKQLLLQPYHPLTAWYTGRGFYIEEAHEIDSNKIIDYLKNSGYAEAKVLSHLQTDSSGSLTLFFDLYRGPLYSIESLSLSGVDTLDPSTIRALIDIEPGALYNPGKLREVTEKIQNHYGVRGFCDVQVNYRAQLSDLENRKYTVDFQIEEGKAYKIGLVRFSGNYDTKPRVLLHESLVIPGQIINTNKIEATERRLLNTGYFKSVQVRTLDSIPKAFPKGDYKDVLIEVEENPSNVRLGLQLGAGMKDGGLYTGINSTMSHFSIAGLPRLGKEGMRAVKGNGEHLNFDFTVTGKSSNYTLSWTDPYFFESRWSFGVDLDSSIQRTYKEKEYYTKSRGLGVFGYYAINDYLRLRLSESVRQEDLCVDPEALPKLFANQARHKGVFNTVSSALLYDSTDRLMLPYKGFRSHLGVNLTDGPAHYLKIFYHNSFYYSFFSKSTLKIRLDFDTLDPIFGSGLYSIPLSHRFLNGEEDSLRGYDFASLGTKDPDNQKLYGALTRYVGSLEAIYRLNETASLFVFHDHGILSNLPYQTGPYYSSYGWGVRLDVLGRFPLTLGLGYPLREKDPSLRKNFFFSIGAKF